VEHGHYPVNVIPFGVKLIKARFKLNDQENKQARGNANCEANNVYRGVAFISKQIAPGGFDVISYHGFKL
jgi:hypothetical protein